MSLILGYTLSRIRSRDLRKEEKAEQELMEGYDQGSNGSAAKEANGNQREADVREKQKRKPAQAKS